MNTVKLTIANKQVVAAHALSAKVEAPAGAVVVEKTVYGPTAYNRFIVDGRYVAKNVVEQIWVALANGAHAAATEAPVNTYRTVAKACEAVALVAVAHCPPDQLPILKKHFAARNFVVKTAHGYVADLASVEKCVKEAHPTVAPSTLEQQLAASIARNLKVAA